MKILTYFDENNQEKIFNGVIPRYEDYMSEILWEGSATSGTITNSKTGENANFADYDFILVEAQIDNSQSQLIYSPNGKSIQMLETVFADTVYFKSIVVNFKDSTFKIVTNRTSYIYIGAIGFNDGYSVIKTIVGFKKL